MNTVKALDTASTLLTLWAKDTERPDPNRLDVMLEITNLLPAVKALYETGWGYLATITGLDLGVEVGEIEVLYHFCAGAVVVTLRVRTPREAASVPSICDIIPSASFAERELSEMLGVTVLNTPNSSHLFLPDDWPDDSQYPLRKDFLVKNEA